MHARCWRCIASRASRGARMRVTADVVSSCSKCCRLVVTSQRTESCKILVVSLWKLCGLMTTIYRSYYGSSVRIASHRVCWCLYGEYGNNRKFHAGKISFSKPVICDLFFTDFPFYFTAWIVLLLMIINEERKSLSDTFLKHGALSHEPPIIKLMFIMSSFYYKSGLLFDAAIFTKLSSSSSPLNRA